MRTIEIDDLNSWITLYTPFFAAIASPGMWQRWLDPEDYSGADTNIEKLAKFKMPTLPVPVSWLQDQCVNFCRENYTHAAFYHGCRIANPSDYEHNGLRCCDVEALKLQAISLWGDTREVRMALTGGAAWRHAQSCSGKVGLWYSREGALHHGQGYMTGGSEFLRVIAGELGKPYLAELESNGRPALVRCVVPLGELNPGALRNWAILPLRRRLTRFDPGAPPGFYALDWAFMHEHPIPRERISIEYLG